MQIKKSGALLGITFLGFVYAVSVLKAPDINKPFNRELWHSPANSNDRHDMVNDLIHNVIDLGQTSREELIEIIGSPTDKFGDEWYYGLPARESAFDATYLIIKFNRSGCVSSAFVVDH